MPPKAATKAARKTTGGKKVAKLPWNKQHPARQLIVAEMLAGNIPLNDDVWDARLVWETYKDTMEFKIEGMANDAVFISRVEALRKIVIGDMPWSIHPARQLLFDEMAAGRIPLTAEEMGPDEVFAIYKDSFEFQGMPNDATFTRRLKDLREIVDRDKDRAKDDLAALKAALTNHQKDVPAVNHRGEPQYNGSDIQKFLIQDIKDNKHVGKLPSIFQTSRPCYSQLDANTFRWKLQQEIRTIKYKYTLKYRADEKLQETLRLKKGGL